MNKKGITMTFEVIIAIIILLLLAVFLIVFLTGQGTKLTSLWESIVAGGLNQTRQI